MKKILLTMGSVTALAAPIAAVVSCSSWDHKKVMAQEQAGQQAGQQGGNGPAVTTLPDDSHDLTHKGGDEWHDLFRAAGRTLPDLGTGIYVVHGGKKYGFVWSLNDDGADIPSHYVIGSRTQGQMVSYLATRIAVANGNAITSAQVMAAFGDLASSIPNSHHFSPSPSPDAGIPTDGGVTQAV